MFACGRGEQMPGQLTRLRNETGMALIGVLLLLILVSALCAALAVSGMTETLAASNQETAAQARAAAEAGLNHAVTLSLARLTTSAAGSSPTAAINLMLRGPNGVAGTDDGSLETLGIPRSPATTQLLAGVSYEARVFDDDDPARGLAVPLTAADRLRIKETSVADPLTDNNQKLVVRAIGYARNNTKVTLEALIGLTTLPAIVTNDHLTIEGSVDISGTNGGLHSNGNLTVGSGSVQIAQDATATGTATIHPGADVGGIQDSGQPTKTVPPIHAIDYKPLADYVLTNSGTMTRVNGTLLTCCRDWAFQGAGQGWLLNSNSNSTAAIGGTYYVEGTARLSGSPGSNASPVSISIIATGSIIISGSPDLRPSAPELLFVTDGDLHITGNLETPTVEGQMLVREQVSIAGNPNIAGQLLVEGAASVFNDVTANKITGNLTLTFNGIAGSGTFAVGGWWEIR
jgi:hypothetical protein